MRKLPLLILALFLAACTGDPYAMVASGNAYIQSTQRARIEQERQAELEEAQARNAAEWEIAQIQAASQATLGAWDILQQQGEATQAAQMATATAEGVLINATQTAMPLQATQTAYPRLAQKEAREQEFNFYAGIAWKVLIMCAVVIGLIILIFFSHSLSKWFIEWRSWKRGVIETSRGEIVAYIFDGTNWNPTMLKIAQQESSYFRPRPNLSEPQYLPAETDTTKADRAEQMTFAQPASNQLIELTKDEIRTLDLLSSAVQASGPEARIIPGWRKLPPNPRKIYGGEWDATVNLLEEAKLIHKKSRGLSGALAGNDYVISDHKNIGDLIAIIERGGLRDALLSPTE